MTYSETGIIATIERLTGVNVTALPREQLDDIDQYHAGGPEAIERLIPHLALTAGTTALDVGSGLGGPARQIARTTGCNVVGVDITPAYVDAAQALTDAAGLTAQTKFYRSDIGSFDQTGFDAAYTIHVQMNIADKKAFYSEIARRLRAGGRLAIFEVCRSADGVPALPLPWSLDGTDSHLTTADDLRDTIQSSGFTLLDWADDSAWARQWFDDLGKRLSAGTAAAQLPALLTDGPARMLNFAIAIATGAVTINRGLFTV
ncbi:SAM-dependent methyltransferase [Actinacidiphila rubida]|uniref:Methyltransferase domain-containing protein n=1 Tax=Actinacidiphila rubida TaxID=310780 RepID=A0A1H8TBV0_9ACTN|nr:methyltransferase domain-containing protein [Actinacidiphila rubida]SEO87978.1 Methyltransferase domain-containing protein [Actinacidiphila rubida]